MPLTTLQKRGALTVPGTDRTHLGWTDGQLLLTTVLAPDRLLLRAIPDADTFWPQYASAYASTSALSSETPSALAGRWIPPQALWHAQTDPASPWRPLWQGLSHGMQTRRCDPTTLAAWADQMATAFPTLEREAHAAYLEAVCAWPGVELPDRTVWLTVCAGWGQSDRSWSEVVWTVRNAATGETDVEEGYESAEFTQRRRSAPSAAHRGR